MDKKFADEMIAKYQKKFFGFALAKCISLNETEELAARITCEAYMTLRAVENIYNWEGYLYRIAHNVYVHYVKEQTKHRGEDTDKAELADGKDMELEYVNQEELVLLKREIAWLSKRHREIVLLYYYHNKKIAEIARMLDLPEGTVKWHLSDAKMQLKEGMKQVRRKGNLGIEPISLNGFGNMGTPGELGDTAYFLNSKLRQNIAYAAYFEPKTIEEIAVELGVSPVFIEDEVEYLTDYGFLDLLPGQRYRTNVFITNIPGEIYVKSRELSRKMAKLICDEYIPELLEKYKEWDENTYVPDNDKNYWYWSVLAKKITDIGLTGFDVNQLFKHNYYVKRKDGGEYVALAFVERQDVEQQKTTLDTQCGPMWHVEEEKNIAVWSLATAYDSRVFGWEDNKKTDTQSFGLFMQGQLPRSEAVLEKYVRLYDRGFLVNRDGTDVVNVIVTKEKNFGEEFIEKIYHGEQLSKELAAKMEALVEEKISLEKPYYPGNMYEMLKVWHKAKPLEVSYVLEELLNRGVLKPLTEEQKKGVMVIAYSDVLPNSL